MQTKLIGKQVLKDLKTKPESYWIKRGENSALSLFREMAKRVPAYKKFLKKHKLNPAEIKTAADLKLVPAVDKENYLKAYPLKELCWDGKFDSERWTFASTSGTTGEPFYFPRALEQDLQYALTAEIYLLNNFQIDKKSTLYVNGFAMGPWIGGVFTYEAIRLVAESGKYQLSITTPGTNKAEIIKVVKKLGKQFDQIIIGGYPPFVKDAIDEGVSAGLNWKEYNLGFVFSAEGFSEGFRDHIIEQTGLKDPYYSSLNHYGTVDLGTMAHETPECILIRKLAIKDQAVHAKVFTETNRLPTLAQYMPEMFYFEEEEGRLYC
ncbi:MAG TPA: hypothetical protein VEA37_06150, partial [Flavobacterium sp.]|nr:hypothetical protein [Flavobacterium sp.]